MKITSLPILLFCITILSLQNTRNTAAAASSQNVRGGKQEQQEEVEVGPNAMFDTAANDEAAPPAVHKEPEESLIAMQFSPDPYAGQDKMELILSGQFSLMHIHLNDDHHEALAVFCEFSMTEQQKDNPSLTPRYMDVYGASEHCIDHPTMVPLHQVAEACRKRDSTTSLVLKTSHNRMSSIEPTAFIFHQPKSGSTLLSNMIAVAASTRVISEPQAIHEVVNCKKCSLATKKQALRDVVYLLGRVAKTQDQQKLYMKLTASSTAAGLSLITRETYPDTKWLFLSRDPATILQKLMNHRVERRHCDESKRRNPGPDMEEYLLTHHEKTKLHLTTPEQACAAYLATNTATVEDALLLLNDRGMAIDYDTDLMDGRGRERIFEFLEIGTTASMNWDRVEAQRGKQAMGLGKEWNGETMLIVTKEVASATAEFSATAII